MKLVREAFEAARTDARAIDDAISVVEDYLAAHPEYVVATAYLGSLYTMKAGPSHLPWVKLKHANAASVLLDSAYRRWLEDGKAEAGPATHPAGLEILLLRGVSYANFPAFLGKADVARDCLEDAEKHSSFAALPAHYRGLAYAHLAALCHRAGEAEPARIYLERAGALDGATTRHISVVR